MAEDVHWNHYAGRFKTGMSIIPDEINPVVKVIVCIPVLAEATLSTTLDSIWATRSVVHYTEVILLFNTNQTTTSEQLIIHRKVWEMTLAWIGNHEDLRIKFYPVDADYVLQGKGGVGWARKVLMDEAARRLGQDGIIICLDADCTVSKGYIDEIVRQFELHQSCKAASIYYEHPFDNISSEEKTAIIEYELHLRYLVQAQRWCGHPFAYHTVGSAMAVTRSAYLQQGGMNTRSAGEDFYFLQKFIETEQLFEINSATVYPAVRVSHRVPFGTGRAIYQITELGVHWKTTNFQTFQAIKVLFDLLEQWWVQKKINDESLTHGLDITLQEYLVQIHFFENINAILAQTTSWDAFRKRFFRYFNAFRMMRYMHYMRDNAYPDTDIGIACEELLQAKGLLLNKTPGTESYLEIMRNLDKGVLPSGIT